MENIRGKVTEKNFLLGCKRFDEILTENFTNCSKLFNIVTDVIAVSSVMHPSHFIMHTLLRVIRCKFIFRRFYHFPTGKLPTSGSVQGITSSNNELYVVTSESPDIEVYDIETQAHRRKIRVEGLVDGWDIVAHANVLYISEFEDEQIHRIQLSDGTSSNWPVNGEWLKMSINKKGNIVVSCRDINRIIEYTPTGSCVREIQVDAIDETIYCLQHAIQLDDDRFVICHSTPTHHRVCIIDSNGRMIKSYGGGPGSGIGQMNGPHYLAIDRNGFMLIADHNNNRIIQLNASLEFIRYFIPASAGSKKQMRMHLHEKTRRLYIAEDGEQKIAIFDV